MDPSGKRWWSMIPPRSRRLLSRDALTPLTLHPFFESSGLLTADFQLHSKGRLELNAQSFVGGLDPPDGLNVEEVLPVDPEKLSGVKEAFNFIECRVVTDQLFILNGMQIN